MFVECYDDNHQPVFSTGSFFEKELNGRRLERGCHLFECVIPGNLLNDGVYVLDVQLGKESTSGYPFRKVCDFVPGSRRL